MNSWHEFYKDRVNSNYQQYFEERYAPMLEIIKKLKPVYTIEEGVGIGSISKALEGDVPVQVGYDNDPYILKLCERNTPFTFVGYGNILDGPDYVKWMGPILSEVVKKSLEGALLKYTLCITHGVLEHFQDADIQRIFARYQKQGVKNIHYVPTDKYQEPSFGDERLLPYQYWLDLVKPKDYLLFNDDHDLLLINF